MNHVIARILDVRANNVFREKKHCLLFFFLFILVKCGF